MLERAGQVTQDPTALFQAKLGAQKPDSGMTSGV